MEGIHIFQIALPFQFPAAGFEMKAGKILDRPGRPVVSGNPLGIDDCDRSRSYGNGERGMQDVARRVSSINIEAFCDVGLRQTP